MKRINDVRCLNDVIIQERNKETILATKGKIYRCDYNDGDYIISIDDNYKMHLTNKILNQYFKLI